MKILLLTQLFQPEPNHLKGLTFAKELRERGHECEVLTAFPTYPLGKLYPGYRMRAWARGEMDGIRVTRCAVFPSHDASAVRRMLTYASFALTAAVAGLILYRGKRFDIVHVYQGPATLMLPGKILAWLTKAKLVLDVQDLWPDSVVSSGMAKKGGALIRLIAWWTRWTYRAADRIIVLSNGYKSRIVQTGVDPGKVSVIYNWCDESNGAADQPVPDDLSRLRQEGKSIVLYAGTMGRVQALQSVLDAAAILQQEHGGIHFAFVGSGVEASQLMQYAAQRNLSNVSFFPRVEAPLMHAIIAGADALLIHLKKDDLGSVGIPQKTQAYLAAGKPVVMAANGEAGQIMKASNAAICCEPEDPEQIANAVKHIFMKTREERETMGANGARFYREVMSFTAGITNVIGTYIQARGGRERAAQAAQVQRSGPLPEVTIRAAREEDLWGIVGVHMEGFRNFFLTFLGPRFLALLYTEIMKEKGSVTLVAVESGGRVIGFAVGVRDQANLYRRLALQRWYAFAAASLRTALAHPSIIPRLFQAFSYVGKAKGTACPALLMSIAVSEKGQGRGLGKELTECFLCAMAENGVDMVCLTTDRDHNESVNAFYRKMGFILAKEYQTRQGRWMNEYVISTKRGRV